VKREFALGYSILALLQMLKPKRHKTALKNKKNILDKCSLELILVFSFPSLDTQVSQQLMHIQVTV
jgi:hypothetical protein